MNLKQLEAFKAIMATGSTIGAATRMGLSQSAVSRLLSQLEEHLGFALFLRKKGRLMATPEAEELLAEVAGLVDGMQRIQRLADEMRVGRSRKSLLKVGVPTSMTQELLPRIVAQFLKEHDDIVVELLTGSYDTIERAVLDRSADLGFVRLPTEIPDFDVEPVLQTEGVCVMPADHPLTRHACIEVQHLRDVPLVMLGRQRALRAELNQVFRAANLTPQVRVEVHSVGAACSFVAEGLGVSIVNGLLASHFRHLPIVTRPFRPALPYAFGLAFRANEPRSQLVNAFAEHLKQRLSAQNA
ncbi:LysR family transcriptional regulator [Pseudomonas sp. P867]|uniref:LysR family transcriptional regulator n=1 Tax=Pseudomonas TaxID=286 RepID=UPI0018E9061D|nr:MULTISPECIES: LysR family transcriptional regulator [Pseudomonas]MBJ2221276.1 LysR family transcriptional regulator [Pseudomonas sp. MF7453]MBY8970434.1 LysR family transcriptional regulator [Pseudomonas sp. P867]MCK3841031.1 LysR family transcriptional regulator [Pseudomonas sp. NCIMB 10586]MCK3841918.1 LysR family transcriptional regulator [Pseudomonas sp. W15Feb34]UEH07613.1 LysR family transcriptional regulator [Pseudomonas sp. HN8-3]